MSSPVPHSVDLNLLVTLDMLLEEASVGRAAQRLGVSPSAVSRALAQLRILLDDPIFSRSAGQRMVPTVRAQAMRAEVRSVLDQARSLLSPQPDSVSEPPPDPRLRSERGPDPVPPSGAGSSRRPPEVVGRFMEYVRLAGAGAGGRGLDAAEAEDAFGAILTETVHPEQVGALLIALHRRGETASELAGFIRAARGLLGSDTAPVAEGALDWPVYISPRGRHPFWFLQAARLVAQAGHPVILHGHSGSSGGDGDLLGVHCRALGIRTAGSLAQARRVLGKHGIVYLPLAIYAAPVARLLRLRRLFGLHTLANTGVRHLNPLRASVSLVGTHRPSYRDIHADALALLEGQQALLVHGGRGVFELEPLRAGVVQRFGNGVVEELDAAALSRAASQRSVRPATFEHWGKLWAGHTEDRQAVNEIVELAAVALMMAGGEASADLPLLREKAEHCWHLRHRNDQ